jgi:glycosyltransferase involved in cell wall biosynthesis
MIRSGWEVHLVTDINEKPTLQGMHHHFVRTMRPSNSRGMRALLDSIAPDRVVVLATPLNLMLSGWYRSVRCRLIAFLSYPFYTYAELARAIPHLHRGDMMTYGRHALVPGFLWAGTLRKYFAAVIAQSHHTALRVGRAAGQGIDGFGLQAGLDIDFWMPSERMADPARRKLRFLYVGSATPVRGFDVLLRAFRLLEGLDVELRIMARGSTPGEIGKLRSRIGKLAVDMSHRIDIVGGWVERVQYREELRAADVVVLPFVLVPSELPVSVIECIACGTPVITTDIDGLPEAVGRAGVIVRSGSVGALADAMRRVAGAPVTIEQLRERCIEARNSMTDWSTVGREWMRVLSQ